jgi:serine/threonine protein phosphatase PrpC
MEIVRAIHDQPDLQAASERLIALANAAGGDDNTTVILFAPRHLDRPFAWRRILDMIRRLKTRLWN